MICKNCGHDKGYHLGSEPCDHIGCKCPGFEPETEGRGWHD